MNQPQYPYVPPLPNPGVPPTQKKRVWPWVVGGILLLLVILGACGGGGKGASTVPPYYGPSGTTAAATAAPAPKPTGPLTQFGDGTYEVGVDVVAGRYKTPGSGGEGIWESCYWERARNDNGDFNSIISNENLQGPGTVTIKKGEFFKTTGGCNWTKQ